ncbi:Aste57867_1167 [Aphanomyces stellatus]|uniref:Aste57867_1167 protein n=1 Tax=Aphanomyces stellatus TaxID=120398 RepID=A0A485K4P8_9STRA|nr:hypothetical protein As57867_001166 [Aphanomyces stellatus]VFT78387.1 Aste57867_1167 [Aphanomyces stellatus]
MDTHHRMIKVEDDSEAKRRRYFREKQRIHALKAKGFRHGLRDEVAALEATLSRAKARAGPMTGALPWHEVAKALQDARDRAIADNRALKIETHKLEQLARELNAWVRQTSVLPASLASTSRTWRNVTLLANPTSRQMGKEWITQHMYHNADRLFMEHGFPAAWDEQGMHDWCFTKTHHYLSRFQSVLPVPMPVLVDLYRNHICQVNMMDISMADVDAGMYPSLGGRTHSTVKEATDTTTLHRVSVTHTSGRRVVAEETTVLVGIFREETRTIVVAQYICDDEALGLQNEKAAQRGWQYWCEFQPASDASTHVRLLAFCGLTSRNNEALPLEDEAVVWGVDVEKDLNAPETIRKAKWRQEMQAAADRMSAASCTRFGSILMEYFQRLGCPPI